MERKRSQKVRRSWALEARLVLESPSCSPARNRPRSSSSGSAAAMSCRGSSPAIPTMHEHICMQRCGRAAWPAMGTGMRPGRAPGRPRVAWNIHAGRGHSAHRALPPWVRPGPAAPGPPLPAPPQPSGTPSPPSPSPSCAEGFWTAWFSRPRPWRPAGRGESPRSRSVQAAHAAGGAGRGGGGSTLRPGAAAGTAPCPRHGSPGSDAKPAMEIATLRLCGLREMGGVSKTEIRFGMK